MQRSRSKECFLGVPSLLFHLRSESDSLSLYIYIYRIHLFLFLLFRPLYLLLSYCPASVLLSFEGFLKMTDNQVRADFVEWAYLLAASRCFRIEYFDAGDSHFFLPYTYDPSMWLQMPMLIATRRASWPFCLLTPRDAQNIPPESCCRPGMTASSNLSGTNFRRGDLHLWNPNLGLISG